MLPFEHWIQLFYSFNQVFVCRTVYYSQLPSYKGTTPLSTNSLWEKQKRKTILLPALNRPTWCSRLSLHIYSFVNYSWIIKVKWVNHLLIFCCCSNYCSTNCEDHSGIPKISSKKSCPKKIFFNLKNSHCYQQ